MKAFMDKDFMLQSATAQHLYHDYAAGMPICDYHCHICLLYTSPSPRDRG